VPGRYIVKYDDRLLDCNLKRVKTYKPGHTHTHVAEAARQQASDAHAGHIRAVTLTTSASEPLTMISMALQRDVPQYIAIPWFITKVMARTISGKSHRVYVKLF